MTDLPRRTLTHIIAKHGRGICESPKRVEASLRDLCGEHRREINIIMGALEERVAADMMSIGKSVPRGVLLARLAARLRDELAYTPEAARWAVETWAVALGVVSEAELQPREQTGLSEDSSAAAPRAAAPNQSPRAPTPPVVKSAATPPPRQQQQSHRKPPVVAHPPPPSMSPPPAPRATPARPSAPAPPPQTASPVAPRRTARRGVSLRSCLIGVLLIIGLIVTAAFAVPAIILILREEQARPSVNEPRIR